MIKTVFLDGDGVVIKKHKNFSQRLLEEGKNINEEKVKEFFRNEYGNIAVGKAELKEKVSEYIKDWNWEGTVDELLNYWFSGENEIDVRILETVSNLREKGIKCYLTSDHSKYRADDLLNNVGLGKHFDGTFFSGYVGYTKNQTEFFVKVLESVNLKPEEVLYFDDDAKNVDVAKLVGVKGIVYSSFEDIEKALEKINLSSN